MCLREGRFREGGSDRNLHEPIDSPPVAYPLILLAVRRWKTDWIHARLHSLYFEGLVHVVVNRAELIGAERRVMKVVVG